MKSAYDCSHVKSVKAYLLLWEGAPAGKIVANYSDNPNGSVCTTTLSIWAGPLKSSESQTKRAGGYGYNKFDSCLDQMDLAVTPRSAENQGTSALSAIGYDVITVI